MNKKLKNYKSQPKKSFRDKKKSQSTNRGPNFTNRKCPVGCQSLKRKLYVIKKKLSQNKKKRKQESAILEIKSYA